MNRDGMLEFPCSVQRLNNGNTLIADAGGEDGTGSEVIEVNSAGEIVWRSDNGYRFAHTARRLPGGNTVIADTTNDRILEVNAFDEIIWSSEHWPNTDLFCYPNNISVMGNERFMVTNRNANGFVIVDRAGKVEFKSTAELKHPHNCEPLADGSFIVADSDEDRVRIINTEGETLWQYAENLRWPRDADLLPNGHVLIADSKNSRLVEVNRDGQTVWEYQASHFANIYELQRLKNGNTLFSDQQHQRVVEVSPVGEEVWAFRNYVRSQPVFDKLQNGFFKKLDPAGQPESWHLATRLSEGGGQLVFGKNAYGKTVPGLEYDRPGALCLQQSVAVEAGQRYTVGGRLKTERLDGMASIQIAFKDMYDGLLGDITQAPQGQLLSGDTEWMQDSFELTVPAGAAFADFRLFLNGTGRFYFTELRMRTVA